MVPSQYVLPDAPREGIVINVAEMRLYYYPKRPEGQPQVVITHPVSIGREDCDLNFPEDLYMSGSHARVAASPDGSFVLVDSASKNGTFLRIRAEHELSHGDYLFLGKQLLRVEITG